MNRSPHSHDSDAESQAALWAARIDGSSLEAADRPELEAWLAKDPSHRVLLSQYCQFSADLEQLLPALVETGAVAMPAKKPSSFRTWNLKWLAGASLACSALLVLGIWLAHPVGRTESFATPVAKRQSLTLADGTRVELNAQTSLVVENGSNERHVRLAQGQAYFEVSKDKSRPFIVETPSGSVRVTGTVFDVHTEAASLLEVTVVEGSVQVRPAGIDETIQAAPRSLIAGDRLSASAKGVSVQSLSSNDLRNALAWRQGQIVFENTTLREALSRFSHFNGRAISVTAKAADLSVGGMYSLDDFDGFLASLEEILPVKVDRDLNGTMRVRLREEP